MDCKYVKECSCICFTFNTDLSSFFYLGYLKNRLRIVQQNLYTNLIMNQFSVPIKQQQLDVDNYGLLYNKDHKLLILTLSDHILVYSIPKRSLVFVGQAHGKNPYFLTKTITLDKWLYFSATDQHNIYGIDLLDCIKNQTITSYSKYKIPPQVNIIDIDLTQKKIVAICNDSHLRVWDIETYNPLRGIFLEKIGTPTCLQFSKGGVHLLIGTTTGYVQAYDGETLGVVNTLVLTQKISNDIVRSLCWFHYSGQAHSQRFLSFAKDGSVKLYSFWFERQKSKKDLYMGKATQLSLLYINRNKLKQSCKVSAHSFANFILFTPGILLFMIDHYPKLYYPVITSQITHSFESLIPNQHRQICWQRDFFFLQGLQIKRLRDQIQTKISLQSILEYQGLKVLKLDYRPCSLTPVKNYKFLLTYYLGNMVRSLILSKMCLQISNQTIQNFREYAGSTVMFLGPTNYSQPLILILQQDRQTLTIISQSQFLPQELDKAQPDQKNVLQLGPGEIHTRNIKIKVQKIYLTPFRNYYVVIYQWENLLRFSNNINYNSQLLDYDVCQDVSLRLNYTDIIIDVIWTNKGQIGAVICLDKVVFINSQLKIIRSTFIHGYVVQGQWLGYTLIVTTKIDVQYVQSIGKPVQLYCIEDYQSKYLIMGIMADRIIGIDKKQDKLTCKVRYFNLMQSLLSGYLSFQKLADNPIESNLCKKIIQCYAPYYLVSQHFLKILNDNKLTSFTQYFIDGNTKLYSRIIRSNTLNNKLQIQRFIQQAIWNKNKKIILDLFLSYWQLQDSNDSYDQQKAQNYLKQLKNIISQVSLNSILTVAKQSDNYTLDIAVNFGDKSLTQIYYDLKDGQIIKMEIQGFKAQNVGQWIGLFGTYIESKLGTNQITQIQPQQQKQQNQSQQGQFKQLLVYYRFDQGKGQIIQDLSNYNNDAIINNTNQDTWNLLDDDPMELEDKWGKKCPPQYSLKLQQNRYVLRQKKINIKPNSNLSIQLWIKTYISSFCLLKLGLDIEFGLIQQNMYIKIDKTIKKLKCVNSDIQFKLGYWNHICWIYDHKSSTLKVLINSILAYQCTSDIKWNLSNGLTLGSHDFIGEVTQLRIWKKILNIDQIKDSMRMPLEIVAEKRKRLKMKIKEKKQKGIMKQGHDDMFPSFPF